MQDKFAIIRLGKDSVSEINKIDSLRTSPTEPLQITVSCTQVPSSVVVGCYCILYLGSDNSKGAPTAWKKGIRALGVLTNKQGGEKYSEKADLSLEIKIVLPTSVNKKDLLAKSPENYFWCSGIPVIGLDSYSNQTVQLIKHQENTQNISALFCALYDVHPSFMAGVEDNCPELLHLLDFLPPSVEIDGYDNENGVVSSGWSDYPLDSVFVRKEQRTVNEVVTRINNNRIILTPDFQRDFIWTRTQQSRLIESCLMRIPLPVFYVAEADDGRIIVVDGLQRLNTFQRYLNNKFSISIPGIEKTDDNSDGTYINKKFKDLSVTLQERLEDTQLTLYILDAKAPNRAKLDIFERVNSGVPLARQQMRNCLFNGPATRWIRDAAKHNSFLKATGESINTKTMRDREIINRFCAFSILGVDQYKADMDDFLAKSLEKMNTFSKEELDELFELFKHSMTINYKLFGRHAFRKSLESLPRNRFADRTIINIALFDVCSVLFARYDDNTISAHAHELQEMMTSLLCNDNFFRAISGGTSGLLQVKTRFQLMEEALAEVI